MTVVSCGAGGCAVVSTVSTGEVVGESVAVAVCSVELAGLELELELDCATASENWGSLESTELSASSAQETNAMHSGNAATHVKARE
ncbi:hypothetical protein ABRP84_09070 [Corynebacterium sp. KPL2861]|uniref:hypothetical protein n=1 Tax=Corynebacterium sp. KPL2861 TaxID=3158319 RepID=UPI0026237223|nr:hypothetical protein [uncultured Corynebacterium sp.]